MCSYLGVDWCVVIILYNVNYFLIVYYLNFVRIKNYIYYLCHWLTCDKVKALKFLPLHSTHFIWLINSLLVVFVFSFWRKPLHLVCERKRTMIIKWSSRIIKRSFMFQRYTQHYGLFYCMLLYRCFFPCSLRFIDWYNNSTILYLI